MSKSRYCDICMHEIDFENSDYIIVNQKSTRNNFQYDFCEIHSQKIYDIMLQYIQSERK